jgi:pre-mRNA-splicing factor SPF27
MSKQDHPNPSIMASTSIDALPYYDKQVEDPALKAAAQALIEAELKGAKRVDDDDSRLPRDVAVFPVSGLAQTTFMTSPHPWRYGRNRWPIRGLWQKSASLAEVLDGYPGQPIRGIDPSKYAPPSVDDTADLDALKEAEKKGRLGEGHMALRYVDLCDRR